MQIVPGILTDDIKEFERRVELAQVAAEKGLVEWVQVDFIDGVYGENKTLAPIETYDVVLKSQKKGLKFEAHLMVSEANMLAEIMDCMMIGFDRLLVELKSIKDQRKTADLIKHGEYGAFNLGFSLDVEIPVSAINKELFQELDVVQVMTVKTGASGQKMMPEMLDKVKELVELRNENSPVLQKSTGQAEYKYLIEVDGGVNLENVKHLKEIGVDLVEANSGLYSQGDFEENLRKLYDQFK